MAIFAPPDAARYCASFGNPSSSLSTSFRVRASMLSVGTSFQEGTPAFATFRDIALRESERLLFLAASHYRRAIDMMIPSACGWAHVTMYYGSFFAAKSLLGMFGAWKLGSRTVIDVAHATPGAQRLEVRSEPSSYRGSHQRFWDFFYNNTPALVPWVDPAFAYVLSPIAGNRTWFIENRNDINYDSQVACGLATSFGGAFRRSKFPTTLPGSTNTQYLALEGLLTIATRFAKQLPLRTDALDSLSTTASRRARLKDLVLDVEVPNLSHRLRRRAVL